MNVKHKSLADIKNEIKLHEDFLDRVHSARMAVRGYATIPAAQRGESGAKLRAMLAATPAKRTFKLLAQGDSWFDYPPGTDLIDCLSGDKHGHSITNIAVAGSTLNDEAYGPVPHELFGIPAPILPAQSDAPDRITELVRLIRKDPPQALLLSAGGNDVAGEEFFSFINNARSGLPPVNAEVLDGVVHRTFKAAYEYLIDTARAAATDVGKDLPVFTHGYDYPWPDGRAVHIFLGIKVGPWFDPTFSRKNYLYDKTDSSNATNGLQERHNIITNFIDSVNAMLLGIAADPKYAGKVFHVDLRRTLQSPNNWANELHPTNDGFTALAAKIDAALQTKIPAKEGDTPTHPDVEPTKPWPR